MLTGLATQPTLKSYWRVKQGMLEQAELVGTKL